MSFLQLALYLLVVFVVVIAASLLTSRAALEKLVASGMLPRVFLGVVPTLQRVVQLLAILLISGGLLKLATDTGWISSAFFEKYGIAMMLIALGVSLLAINWRRF